VRLSNKIVVLLSASSCLFGPFATAFAQEAAPTQDEQEFDDIVEDAPPSSAGSDTANDVKTPAGVESDDSGPKSVEAPPAEAPSEVSKVEADSQTPEKLDPPAKESEIVSESSDTSEAIELPRRGLYGGRFFGRYKMQVAINKPTFGTAQKCYTKAYGETQPYVSFGGDWFPKDWLVNPGISGNMGIYSARGKALKGASGKLSCDSATVDDNSGTSMFFMPLQLGLKAQISPMRSKVVVFDIWTSGELVWWQETRDGAAAESQMLGATQVYTNSGSKTGISTGLSAHVLLNPLDERGVHSMSNSMGIGYVYLTLFAENVKSISKSGLSFGRNIVGLGFTFETAQ
jgi:hypothetical protein